MDDRARLCARSHWAALDAAMMRALPDDEAALCRDGIRWGLADISSKYAARLIDTVGDDAHSVGIEAVGRELALALSAAWADTTTDPSSSPATTHRHS